MVDPKPNLSASTLLTNAEYYRKLAYGSNIKTFVSRLKQESYEALYKKCDNK